VPIFRSDPLDELVIPDGTHVEEHDLVTDGDVLVGGQSHVEFGVRGGNVVAGERVSFGGHIEAEGDCRLDMWCEVEDDVLVGEDAYLGERVHVGGQLKVAGDLDIGDDVDIDDGFEAAGWIVIRNPMPTITFLFVYLSQLLRIGEEEAAEEMLETLMSDERENQPAVIPRSARVGDDAWRVSTPGRIGDGCRLHGNVRAASLVVGRENEVFGSLRAKEGVTVGADTEVTGNVTTRSGTVRIGPNAEIRGDVSGDYVEVHHEAAVEGAIRARNEMSMVSEPVLDDVATGRGAGAGAETLPETEPDTPADPTPAITQADGRTDKPGEGAGASDNPEVSADTDGKPEAGADGEGAATSSGATK